VLTNATPLLVHLLQWWWWFAKPAVPSVAAVICGGLAPVQRWMMFWESNTDP